LNNAMGLPRNSSGGDISQVAPQESSAPQPQLLFGSGPPNLPGHSIWSISLDDTSIKYPNIAATSQPNPPYESPAQPFARLQGHPQPSWSSSYPNSSQSSQNQVLGAAPSIFGPHSHLIGTGSHQRTPSAANFFSSSRSPRNDAFGYSSGIPPQLYHPHAPSSHISDPYIDPAIMAAGSLYPQTAYRGPPLDPRMGQGYAPAPVPPLWGNNG